MSAKPTLSEKVKALIGEWIDENDPSAWRMGFRFAIEKSVELIEAHEAEDETAKKELADRLKEIDHLLANHHSQYIALIRKDLLGIITELESKSNEGAQG